MKNPTVLLIIALAFGLSACRGMIKERPPIHPILDMDYQERFGPQDANPFFEDGRSMRMPVAGTVARGLLREDVAFYDGRTEEGEYLPRLPVPTTRELLLRGQSRYDIYCGPCHGGAGDGEGVITTGGFGFVPAPTFHSDRMREEPDGYLFDVVSNGISTMPGYRHHVNVADRWAIVGYVRALQRAQYAREEDVPPSIRVEIRAPGAAPTPGPPQGEPLEPQDDPSTLEAAPAEEAEAAPPEEGNE